MEINVWHGRFELEIRRRVDGAKYARFDPIGSVRTADVSKIMPYRKRTVQEKGGNFEWNLPLRIRISITYWTEFAYDVATAFNVAFCRREEKIPELRQQLVEDGWSEGRDGLWRSNRFGGSYKMHNALRRVGSVRGEETGSSLSLAS